MSEELNTTGEATAEPVKLKGKAKKEYVKSLPCGERIAYHQKKLIPYNLVICAICLIASLSLIFLPFFRVDIGKIVSNEEVKAVVTKEITKSVNNEEESGDVGGLSAEVGAPAGSAVTPFEEQNGGESTKNDFNVNAIAGTIITSFFDHMKSGNLLISFSAFDSVKISANGTNELKKIAVNSAKNITENLVGTIKDTLEKDEVKASISDAVLDTFTTSIIERVSGEGTGIDQAVLQAHDAEIKTALNKIDDVKNEAEMRAIADDVAVIIRDASGKAPSAEEMQKISDELAKLYNDTNQKIDESGKEVEFSLETVICVSLSENMSSEQIKDLLNSKSKSKDDPENSAGPSKATAPFAGVFEEIGEPEKKEIYFTYSEYVSSLDSVNDELVATVEAELNKLLDEADATLDKVAKYYAIVGYAMIGFAGLWFILFLASLIRIFMKNKRFVSFYVKALCWIPCMIWLVITLASKASVWKGLFGEKVLGEELLEKLPLVTGIFGSISSFTWISGLCLIILCVLNVFWAFPIKRKIRKAKKELPTETPQVQ